MNDWVMNDFCQGLLESFPGEVVWRLDLENSRNSWGRKGGRAFQAGSTEYTKAERCGSIGCVLESVGLRVYVSVYGVWGKVGPHCSSH